MRIELTVISEITAVLLVVISQQIQMWLQTKERISLQEIVRIQIVLLLDHRSVVAKPHNNSKLSKYWDKFICPNIFQLHNLLPMARTILQRFPLPIRFVGQNRLPHFHRIQILFHREPA